MKAISSFLFMAMTWPNLYLGVVAWPIWATQLWAVRCIDAVIFSERVFSDFVKNPTDLSVVTCWKMSIEAILKAAEYIERRERGKHHGFAVFSSAIRVTYVLYELSCVERFGCLSVMQKRNTAMQWLVRSSLITFHRVVEPLACQ